MADHIIKFKAEFDSSNIKKVASQIKQNIGYAQNDLRTATSHLANPDITEHERKSYQAIQRGAMKDISEGNRSLGILQPGESGGGGSGGGGGGFGGAGIGLAGKAGLAWLGYKAYGFAANALAANSSTSGDYLRLTAQGLNRGGANSLVNHGANLGYMPAESRALMSSMMSNIGSVDSRMFKGAQNFGRAYGVDTDVLSNLGGTLRQTGTEGDDLFRKHSEILASAINSKIEKGRLGEYLQVTSGLIEKMSSTSFGMQTGGIAGMMSMLTGQGGINTPANSAAQIGNLNSLITNPSQQQSPLVYKAMAETLQRGGYKGNMPMAMMAIQTMGLGMPDFSDPNKFSGLSKDPKMLSAYKGLSEAFNPVTFAKIIARDITAMTSQMGPLGLGIAGVKYGFKGGAAGAANFLSTVNSGSFTSDKARQALKELGPQQEKSLADVNSTIEKETLTIEAIYDLLKERLGQKEQGSMNAATSARNKYMAIALDDAEINKDITSVHRPEVGSAEWRQAGRESDMKKFGKISPLYMEPLGSSYSPNEIAGGIFGDPLGDFGKLLAPAVDPANNTSSETQASKTQAKAQTKAAAAAITKRSGLLTSIAASAPGLYDKITNNALGIPMNLTETWRGANEDKAHGGHGSPTSNHKTGRAGDISVNGMSQAQIDAVIAYLNEDPNLRAAEHFKGDKWGSTANHIHVDDYTRVNAKILPGDLNNIEE